MINRREELERQRQAKIDRLETEASNELLAPRFRENAERQLNEMGVGKDDEPVGWVKSAFKGLFGGGE